ncbi:hypothetical protein NE237_030589 [Protea cynaroides]|uniref:Uncharacterized protein n=1 Tax=Protea cynaroides TaxID=273540 RepID=A0A9Q0GXI0_9MAGN|nr:hypothetical protein NE237_030589 [Protea cynaroides]
MATDQENIQRFTLTKTVSVYPKSLHPPTLLSLSNIDRNCPALTYLILFYPSRTHQNTSAQSLFRALKMSMEETLSIWFPAAGRITFNQTDGRLDLLCNNAGAVLVEKVTQLKISEIGDLSQYNEFYENLVCKPVFNGNFSEMPLVTAQARTKTLGLRKERMVCLQFAVDARNRMVPPLPRGFSGNAYVLASVCCTAGELEEASYDGIIQKIKEAKRSVNNDYVNAYLEALEAQAPQTSPQASLPPLKELTMVSDWTRTPFHKVDFGQGEAASASPLVSPLPQVAYFMQKPQETRSIDVRIGLLPQYLKAFSHYFLTELQ